MLRNLLRIAFNVCLQTAWDLIDYLIGSKQQGNFLSYEN